MVYVERLSTPQLTSPPPPSNVRTAKSERNSSSTSIVALRGGQTKGESRCHIAIRNVTGHRYAQWREEGRASEQGHQIFDFLIFVDRLQWTEEDSSL
jgi:hypothetical protein